MQYLLTQEELDALKKEHVQRMVKARTVIQALCIRVCDSEPVNWGWGGPDPKPWGCILTKGEKLEDEWYCDQCPVQKECPHEPKAWSK